MIPSETKTHISKWLYNPFRFVGGGTLFWIGAGVLLLHIPVGYLFDARFDGALDMHISRVNDLYRPLLDVIIAWVPMLLLMYLSAIIFKSPIRFIDIAGATAVSRFPILISVIPAKLIAPDVQSLEELINLQGPELWILIAGSIVLVLFLAWYFILLFNAYKINSNLSGWKLATGFFASVIGAEIISKIALVYI